MTRIQCKVSDTQVTVKACGPLVIRSVGMQNHRKLANFTLNKTIFFFFPGYMPFCESGMAFNALQGSPYGGWWFSKCICLFLNAVNGHLNQCISIDVTSSTSMLIRAN